MSENDEHLIDLWFKLKDRMVERGLPQEGQAIRPPSLRDAAYARVMSMRNVANPPPPEMVEAFVNGMELGAISALRQAWELNKLAKQAGDAAEQGREAQRVQGSSEDL
jgi:hypothetical protein